MLDNAGIRHVAVLAARVAFDILGLAENSSAYSIELIDEPSISEDVLTSVSKKIIFINLPQLEPFPVETVPVSDLGTDEDKFYYENYRYILKICYSVFYVVRRIYQRRAVEIYINNRSADHMIMPLENEIRCRQWLKEMENPELAHDIEEDADDFAYYLTNRFPIERESYETDRSLMEFKKKYDSIPINVRLYYDPLKGFKSFL